VAQPARIFQTTSSRTTATTILGFHKLGAPDEHGRPRLIVERHGSLLASRLALRVYKDVRRGLRSMA
jgi:hypothetical protein